MQIETTHTLIIGAGYAGLYAAHLHKQKFKTQKLVLIERESHIGGRASNIDFGGTTVVTGAGIGRYDKDECLKGLMRDMGMKIETFEHNPAYAFEPLDVQRTFSLLKKHINKAPQKSFREFATDILGKTDYTRFVESTGYTDYENEDAISTLKYYGMDDNFCQDAKLFSVPWKQLAERIVSQDRIDVRLDCEAVQIKTSGETDKIRVKTKRGPTFVCDCVIVATTVSVLRKLFPHNKLYKQIQSQPFLRVYGKFTADTKHIMAAYVKKYTVVSSILQKIIPMDPAKGVYMIAYSDNKSAVILEKIQSMPTFCRLVEKALGIPSNSLCLIAIRKCYFYEGTHYVKSLPAEINRKELIRQAQFPAPNVFVVGEAACNGQGWVEGALKSVHSIY